MIFAFHLISRFGWSVGMITIVLVSLGLGATLAMKYPWADRYQGWVMAGIGVGLLIVGLLTAKAMGIR